MSGEWDIEAGDDTAYDHQAYLRLGLRSNSESVATATMGRDLS